MEKTKKISKRMGQKRAFASFMDKTCKREGLTKMYILTPKQAKTLDKQGYVMITRFGEKVKVTPKNAVYP